MNILIAGASGFIGTHLIHVLSKNNSEILALSRHPERQKVQQNVQWKKWKDDDTSDWISAFERADVVINLVGENLGTNRWTQKRRELLVKSRLDACYLFVRVFRESQHRPATYIQASAIGYYGPAPLINEKSVAGSGFLAELARKWEQATVDIEKMGVNRILLRIGVILAADSLIIKKFRVPFFFFVGGHLAGGNQIISWIHIEDVVDALLFIIKNVKTSRVYNLTAPNPVTMREFCKKFGKKMKRPSWLHVPAFILKILFGQVAEETMLKGDKIIPENLLKMGYNFKYNNIDSALDAL